ncbi:PH domain-containing protein [Melittangium boletus]|uniref:PH domain-containing protein n=1 Tax=Melittangium boletus TaxID=83453 RepID=UPI003DA6B6FA
MTPPRTRQATAWIYEGLWAVLTDLFHVPDQPPVLPTASGAQVVSLRPCAGWLRYRKVSFWLGMLSTLLTIGAVGAPLLLTSSVRPWLLFPVLGLVVLFGLVGYVSIHLGFDTTWYVLSDRALRIRRGVWTLHETTITFDNVQNVKISQGPLQRIFDFSDLVIETAGGGGGGPQQNLEQASHVGLLAGIENPTALREQIMNRVRASRSAGLGDEHDVPTPPSGASPTWSPAHLEELRRIASHVARLRARSD